MLKLAQGSFFGEMGVLSDSAAAPVASSIAKFRDDYLALIRPGAAVAVTA